MAELSLLFKATVILAAALVAARATSRARASVRALLFASAFGVLLLLPVVAAVIPPRAVELPAGAIDFSAFVTQPVAVDIAASSAPRAVASDHDTRTGFQLPSATTTARIAWVAGALLFAAPMLVALWQLRRLRRDALPWLEGRALVDDVVRQAGVTRRVEVFLHEALAAPMTCGLFRPAVGLPLDAPSWPDAELRHALVHEMEHVRRRDWPVHLMARLACALYWFHPLAWIAWRRLCLESERACDDAVLRGAEGTAYAEQLVMLARRISKRSPVPMLSMADRSNLATRVAAVLDDHLARGRTGLVATIIIVTIATAATLAISPLQPAETTIAAPPQSADAGTARFEVASIRVNTANVPLFASPRLQPGGRMVATNVPLTMLMRVAYNLEDNQIAGGPSWVTETTFDLVAQGPPTTTMEEARAMLRTLLVERFRLMTHTEQRQLPVYLLTRASSSTFGPQLRRAGAECAPPRTSGALGGGPGDGPGPTLPPTATGGSPLSLRGGGSGCRSTFAPGQVSGRAYTMDALARQLSGLVDRPVINRTGEPGTFDVDLSYATTDDGGRPDGPDLPSIFTAVREQLGLRLDADRAPIDVVVIDRAEMPSNNATAAQTAPAGRRLEFEVASIKPNPALGGLIGGRCQGTNVDPNATGPIAALAQAAGVAPLPPGRCRFTRVTLKQLITYAYGIPPADADRAISGGPGWVDDRRFDVEAKAEQPLPEVDMKQMLQAMLTDRFGLRVHRETREVPGLALVLAGTGTKLQAATGAETRKGVNQSTGGPLTAQNATIAELARALSMRLGRVVEDATGLTGRYSFSLTWTPGPDEKAPFGFDASNLPPEIRAKLQTGSDKSGTALTTALQEQLGLRLQSRRISADLLVIDRAEPPGAN